jgi:hypothetical protein
MRHVYRVGPAVLVIVLWAHTASAQVDLSGMWQTLPRNQDGSGMTGDTAGVPVSENGRWRGDSWSPEDFDVAEWVCRPHSFHYGLEGGLSRIRRNRKSRSGWMGVRILPRTPFTRGAASRPVNGTVTCWW